MTINNEIAVRAAHAPSLVSGAMDMKELAAQMHLIQQLMRECMSDGEHYGKIPGCGDKPTLLKPGSEKICFMFRLAPTLDVIERDLEKGHREYVVTTTMTHIPSGAVLGQGVGSCTTLESKYRYRDAKTITDKPVPRAYWDLRKSDPAAAQALLGGKGKSAAKNENGEWMIAETSGDRVEHTDPADYYNTCLKMAKKRSLSDATLTCTAASDIFTQDIEDMADIIQKRTPKPVEPQEPLKTKTARAAEIVRKQFDNGGTYPTVSDEEAEQAEAERTDVLEAEAVEPGDSPVCGFGKHQGVAYADIPLGYLKWMVQNDTREADMADAEIKRRASLDTPSQAGELSFEEDFVPF